MDVMTYPTSPELALTIACCRWPRSPERDAAVRDAAASVTDWSLFDRLLRRHRVTLLARDALTCAGVLPSSAVAERLAARAAECAVTALVMTRESIRLQRAFGAAGLPAFIVKGVTVGILAYGDPCLKESWDIDLLTSVEALPQAHSLLESLGYDLYHPDRMTSEQFRRFVPFTIEAGYLHRENGLTVELHWRMMRNRRLLSDFSVHSPSQVVPAAGAELLTFDNELLFTYLCAHGSEHAWSRLKWLADLGAFIGSRGPGHLERFYESALQAGAGRMAGSSLLLCRRLLGTSVSPSVLPELENDRVVRYLETTALHYINRLHEPEGPTVLPFSRKFVSHFFLAGGAGYLLERVRNIWHHPLERARYGHLAPLVRIPLWLKRLAGRLYGHLVSRSAAAMSD